MSTPERAADVRERPHGETVHVTVRLLASYRQFLPRDHDERAGYPLPVAPGTPAGQVLDSLPIATGDRYTFLINGRHAERDDLLQGGDVLAVFPAAGGG